MVDLVQRPLDALRRVMGVCIHIDDDELPNAV
ncbi:hypothetical protein PC129_g13067 [Phytophthora cactorum]|uniref:Uncharacterized protein n=1 Tax=Phytophthora cactorum TaxID=29920 RepID=A0A329RWH7_9STRA|nr:hypothetical protein Pcac1_g8368 [Phytophthora cactorum]KAG2819660.1 hypothetical protein PC111_g11788 [Phytophthora cactorum]KAG2822103.1 hypothetical protein PC112_g11092 [Phytophthora cactorum]KAG2856497.1 hypothetical protein PC113_g11504 [Phytophthora cactorum]KAG2883853.1 hypothetical protein PC114_g20382 [Phytophthora cactorum]